MRIDGRRIDQLGPVKITPGYIDYPEGSALIEMGMTRVPFVGRPLDSISFVTTAPSGRALILPRLGRRCRACHPLLASRFDKRKVQAEEWSKETEPFLIPTFAASS